MKIKLSTLLAMLTAGMLAVTSPAIAQTPDGETPAEEQSCLKYEGEGARHGLCVAYCEAQDCKGKTKFEDLSCDRIFDKFVSFSVKKGFVAGTKKTRIDCVQTACTPEDVAFCGAREVSLQNPDTLVCEAFCDVSFEGLSDGEKPLPICVKTELPIKWKRCFKKEPL